MAWGHLLENGVVISIRFQWVANYFLSFLRLFAFLLSQHMRFMSIAVKQNAVKPGCIEHHSDLNILV